MVARLSKNWGQTTFSRKRGLTPILLAAMLAFPSYALACKVLDPELQGSYTGPCVNGLAQGDGVAKGIATYRGHFEAGKKEGHGVKTWPNGDRYDGEFVDGRKQGHGVYTWGRGPWQGERYDGDYVHDERNGYGVYHYANGDVYKGEWKNDVPIGAPTPMMLAQRRFHEESRKAVAKIGQKLCRPIEVDSGKREWIRGTVVALAGDKVDVRIDDPGRGGATLDGVELKKGTVVSDEPYGWTPCL
jgi:hypothetical protein